MSPRAEELAGRFTAFNKEFVAFVENCPEKDWTRTCPGENWPVGVVARHVAAGHYRVLALAKMIVEGRQLPDFSGEGIDLANAKHAEKHAGCTKDEVLELLRKNGTAISDYIAGLDDAALDRTGHLAASGGPISTQQIIENLIIQSAGEHLASLKSATAK